MIGNRQTRTNNHLEAYNSSLKRTMCSHQHPWTFLRKLKIHASIAVQKQINEARRGVSDKSRSKLSAPLNFARGKLLNGDCSVEQFLLFMARQPRH
jgi:hypothetical protein